MIHGIRAKVLGKKTVCPEHVRLRLDAPEIAAAAAPGQFVNVRCGEPSWRRQVFEDATSYVRVCREHPAEAHGGLLMRPFAVYRSWTEGARAGQIEVLFRIVGRGTRALGEIEPGESVDILGPLGTGFDLEFARKLSTAVIVAGGVGVAPLFGLAEFLRRRHVRTLVMIGAMSEHDVPLETLHGRAELSFLASHPQVHITAREFDEIGCEVAVVTMEGEEGYPGLPTSVLDGYLHFSDWGARGACGIFTCGPWAMMKQVARDAHEHDVRCQALLEERMGCGVGVCMGCSIAVKGEGGLPARKRVCIDGPVFDANEVLWDEQ